MLRPGMIVQRHDGTLIRLVGRNGCMRSVWWGHQVRDGRPVRNSMRLVRESQCAVMTGNGLQWPLSHIQQTR